MTTELQEITITDADGECVAVGSFPAHASALEGMSAEEILLEMEAFMQRAVNRAYQLGFDAHRDRVSRFLVVDRREMIKASNRRGGR